MVPCRSETRRKQPLVFNFQTTVHHHGNAMLPGQDGGLFVDDPQLHPDKGHAFCDRLLHDGQNLVGFSKNTCDINLPGHSRYIGKTNAIQYGSLAGIDGNNGESLCQKIAGYPVAGPIRLW